MTINPRIPMSPDELPQQRIYEVVGLPKRPELFDCEVGYGAVPDEFIPKHGPRSPVYLGQVEWAWSPMHNRLDAYYLHRGRKHWLMWIRYFDDNWGKWEWSPVACVSRKGITERQAATHLLIEFWRHDARYRDVDRFHWINEGAFLTVADLSAIGRHVWDENN